MLTTADIRRALAERPPLTQPCGSCRKAAVALLLREGGSEPNVLFIRRAEHKNDPWSGDLAFPGGKVEADDAGPRRAAERETLEEIGLDLARAEYLGRLDDIQGAYLPVLISCFVYRIDSAAPLVLNGEVREVHWIPLATLRDPDRHGESTFAYRGTQRTHPVIDLLGPGYPLLWGITYRLAMQLLRRLEDRAPRETGALHPARC